MDYSTKCLTGSFATSGTTDYRITIAQKDPSDPTIVELHWMPPNTLNAEITGYVVFYSIYKSRSDSQCVAEIVEGDIRSICIVNLKSDTTYYFRVKAHTSMGDVNTSNIIPFTTYGTPGYDLIIEPFFINDPAKLYLYWSPPRPVDGEITGYVVFYSTDKDKRECDWTTETLEGDIRYIYLEDLTSDTIYYFKIQCNTSMGSADPSPIMPFTTYAIADYRITIVQKDPSDPTIVELHWMPPSTLNAEITGYVVIYSLEDVRERDCIAEIVEGDIRSICIKDLTSDTTYYFKVQARTSKGDANQSPVIPFTTSGTPGYDLTI